MPSRNYGPTRVSSNDCELVAEFFKEITSQTHISPSKPDRSTEIELTNTLISLEDNGKDGAAPLIVTVTKSTRTR